MMKKHERKVTVMTTKIVFTMLALAVIVLPAAAQNQFLTSFSDSLGPHVFYQADPLSAYQPYFGLPLTLCCFHHIWQIAPTFGWSGDMDLLPASSSDQARTIPPSAALSPLVSYFRNTTNRDFLLYINYLGDVDVVQIDSNGAINAFDWSWLINGGMAGPGCGNSDTCPDGKSLTGFTDDSGPSVYWTERNGGVVHWHIDPPNSGVYLWSEMFPSAGLTPNLPCGVVNSALFALPDTRSSPNPEQVFYVGGSGHLCDLEEVPGMFGGSTPSQDLTAMCQSPCGDGAPQPMLKSPLTGFTDSAGVHVFYLDTLGHVNEFVVASKAFSNLSATNLNLWNRVVCPPLFLPGGFPVHEICPAAVADSLTSFTNAFGPQVFYVDVKGHVNQLNLKSNTHQDLTASLHREPAAQAKPLGNATCAVGTSLSSIGVDNNGVEWVYYIDDVGHVWELGSVNGSTWLGADLTGQFGTPIAIVQRSC